MFVAGAGGVWLQPTNGAAALFLQLFFRKYESVDGEALFLVSSAFFFFYHSVAYIMVQHLSGCEAIFGSEKGDSSNDRLGLITADRCSTAVGGGWR